MKRDAAVDLARLQQFGRDLATWPGSFWYVLKKCNMSLFFTCRCAGRWVIFPEGTRKNAKKLAASQEFAKKNNKPVFTKVGIALFDQVVQNVYRRIQNTQELV